jgi:hypothetical protein
MITFLLLLTIVGVDAIPAAPTGVIEATIRGTAQPLDIVLLFRDGELWKDVDQRALPPSARLVRFDKLPAGVYQVLLRGAASTEQLATKFVIGNGDTRRATIAIETITVIGRVTRAGGGILPNSISLRHKELRWYAAFDVRPDGTFRIPMWQRGTYTYAVRAPSMATSHTGTIDLQGPSPIQFSIDIPDGRVTGILRDAKSGAAIEGAFVALQSDSSEGSQHVSVMSNEVGRFDFSGLRLGRQTVRILSARYLQPSPIVFEFDAANSRRDLDIHLDSGRTATVTVVDAHDHPVANATVFAVSSGRRRSRGTTDESGMTSIAVPVREPSALFVIPNEGGFALVRPAPLQDGRVSVRLPRSTSSLRIRVRTTEGKPMPPFSLLMRYDGEVMPLEIADELSVVQGIQFATKESEAYFHNIPAGTYDFWPYRTTEEAESIIAISSDVAPPIHVEVRPGENTILVKFAAR